MRFPSLLFAAVAASSHLASPASHAAGGSDPSRAASPRSSSGASASGAHPSVEVAQTSTAAASSTSAVVVDGGAPRSPKWQALARGAFDVARTLPAKDAEEDLYLTGAAHLARHDVKSAEQAHSRMTRGTHLEADLAWQIAHAKKDPRAIAASAGRLCALGDPTGRACVDEEFYGGRVVRGVALRHGPTEVKLAPSAPFPLTLGRIGPRQTGVIVDTGASQTVISRALADELGLALSKKAFPIGVVAGAGIAEAHLAVLPELWIGHTQITTLPVLVVDLPDLDKSAIQVILAPHRDLEGLAVEIDFAEHRLRIHDDAPVATAEDLVVPYLHAGFDLVVPAKVGSGEEALFSFDTGMEQAFALSRDYAGRLPKDKAALTPKAGAVLYGAGQAKAVEQTSALPVELAGRPLPKTGDGILTSIPAGKVFQISGLLGNALWKDRTVVIDTDNHEIVVRAPSSTLLYQQATAAP